MTLPPLIAAMRPRQWSKNVFVLAGIVFAGKLFERPAQLRVLSCFVLFCAASSAVYLVNDVVDRSTDAHHPLKRRSELVLLGQDATLHRMALGHYSLALVDSWLTALAAAAIVSYAIYTQSPRTVEHFGTTNLLYTVPFVIYALFRYQHHVVRQDAGGDPGNLLVQDRALWMALLGWAITAAVVIYG
jgi:4-hydroxybenzoate polyprenyltransferase